MDPIAQIPTTRSDKRSSLALRGALSAAVATSVLLGGFGAFALWSNAFDGDMPQGALTTGRLEITDVADSELDGGWFFQAPGDGVFSAGATDTAINPATFIASPNDVVYWVGEVTVIVEGSDMVAKLVVDESEALAAVEGLDGFITVGIEVTGGGVIEGRESADPFTVPVKVTVTFGEDVDNEFQEQLAAFDLSRLKVTLTQVPGSDA